MRKFTATEVKEIAKEYADRNAKVIDIRKKWGINSRDLKKILTQLDVPMRCPNACHPKGSNQKAKTCPKCRKKIQINGAKFCPFCGEDIRSEKDIILERGQGLYAMCRLLPTAEADKAHELITALLEYIRKEG